MDIERITLTPRTVVGVRETVRPEAMKEFFGHAMERVHKALQENGLHPSGPPLALYRGDPERGFDVTAGFPVAAPVATVPGLEVTKLPAGRAVSTIHIGSYESMRDTYARIGDWMQEQHLTSREPMWEEYLTDPSGSPDPATWRTRIVFPLA